MPDDKVVPAPPVRERIETANLRLEISALATRIDAASLPAALGAVRRTVALSALGVSVALIISGLLHWWSSEKVDRIEKRVEILEQHHKDAR